MPVETLKKLPIKGQKLWEAAYKAAKAKGLGPKESAKVAWSTVKKKYTKKGDSWISRGGHVIGMKTAILRNFSENGDTFVEVYVSSFDPDDGDLTKSNGGMSYMLSKNLGERIAKELVDLRLGGGIEHDTFLGSKTYNPEADEVWYAVSSQVVDDGIKAIFKLNKDSVRYEEVLKGIPRRKYKGASLEIIPYDDGRGIKLKNINGRYVNEITDYQRLEGVTLTRSPLDKRARITATFTATKKK